MRRAAVALLIVVTAACGHGTSTTSPGTWAGRLCTDLGSWLSTVQAGADTLRQDQARATSLQQARTQLVDYLEVAVAATDRLLDASTKEGEPDVGNGKALTRALRAGIEKAKRVFEDGRAEARRLPTGDVSAYRTQAQALGTDIAAAGKDLQASVTTAARKYRTAAVDRALREQPACRRLGSETGSGTL